MLLVEIVFKNIFPGAVHVPVFYIVRVSGCKVYFIVNRNGTFMIENASNIQVKSYMKWGIKQRVKFPERYIV